MNREIRAVGTFVIFADGSLSILSLNGSKMDPQVHRLYRGDSIEFRDWHTGEPITRLNVEGGPDFPMRDVTDWLTGGEDIEFWSPGGENEDPLDNTKPHG